jgi:hypothetical protein
MMMVRRVAMALILVATFFSAGTALASDEADNVLVDMFAWWNATIKVPGGFTEEGFARFFAEDAAIIVNNREVVRGVRNMVPHFQSIQENTESVEIVLPFEEEFHEGNKIFTYHLIRASENGTDRLSHVMGYAVIEDGKIALVKFLSYTRPDDEPVS